MLPEAPTLGVVRDEVRDEEPDRAGDHEDDERARRSIRVFDRRSEISNPHHVEEDVEQTTMEEDRGEQRPPPMLAPRDTTGHAELIERTRARRQDRERTE
jgi:hypothetical protein